MKDFFTAGQKKIIYAFLAAAGIYLGFRYLMPLIMPLLLAFIIVYLCDPWLKKVQKKARIRKEILLAGLILLCFGLMLLAGWFLGRWCLGQMGGLPGQLKIIETQTYCFFSDCCNFFEQKFGVDSVHMENLVVEKVNVFIENLKVEFLPKMMKESWWYIKKFLAAGAFLGVSFISSILLCKDYDKIMGKAAGIGMEAGRAGAGAAKAGMESAQCRPGGGLETVIGLTERIIHLIVVFLKSQFLILCVISLICCIGFVILRIESGIALGIAAGVLDALPFIGTGIVIVPTALWQLINGRYGAAIACMVIYVLCVAAREFLEPKLMGSKTGIYPVVMLLSVYAGVKLFGLSGIIKGPLAVVVFREIYRYQSQPDGADASESK